MARRPEGQVTVSVCGRTHKGRVRKENQDSLLLENLARASSTDGSDDRASIGPTSFALGEQGAILLVADGMGGRAGGARASAMAAACVRESIARDGLAGAATPDEFVIGMRQAIEVANEEIHEEARRDDGLRGMGTTATLAGIRGGVVYFAQVGDSRGYLLRKDTVARLTRDQSFVQDLIDSGVVDEEGAKNIRDNRIMQALGTMPSVTPALTFHELRRDDVVLLCSDGLSRVVEDHEILAVVKASEDCLVICERLIALANSRGGPDNITVLVARVGGEGLGPAGRGDALARRPYESGAK